MNQLCVWWFTYILVKLKRDHWLVTASVYRGSDEHFLNLRYIIVHCDLFIFILFFYAVSFVQAPQLSVELLPLHHCIVTVLLCGSQVMLGFTQLLYKITLEKLDLLHSIKDLFPKCLLPLGPMPLARKDWITGCTKCIVGFKLAARNPSANYRKFIGEKEIFSNVFAMNDRKQNVDSWHCRLVSVNRERTSL